MKYIGYLLFLMVFILIFFVQSAKDFFVDSFELAPEITVLVSVAYIYIVLLTIILSIFPKIVNDRLALYDHHIKMSCSVMVSLGLVGTFLGLVEMISGIGAALSGEEADFAKRMATLLGAISTSLGAMSFAFVTSILGVGISAYSLVAATFVSSSFSEEMKKQLAEENKNTKNNNYIELVDPILERIQTLEDKHLVDESHFLAEASIPASNVMLDRIKKLEDQFINIDLTKFEEQFTPLIVLNSITQHHQLLEKHNELLTDSILQLNRNHLSLVKSLDDLSVNVVTQSKNITLEFLSLNNLNDALLKNNTILLEINNSANEIKNKTSSIFDKFKKLFE